MNIRIIFLLCLLWPVFCPAEPTRIGVLAPLSGDVAAWGIDTQRALSLANEMHGDGNFEILFEDDRCLGKNAVGGAQKLLKIDKVQYGMIVCTESTLSTAPLFEQAKVVVVAPGATGAAVSAAGDFIFRTWPSDAKMAELVFNYAKTRFKRVAVFTENRGLPQEFSRVFLNLARDQGLSTSSEDFASSETDNRSVLSRIRSQNPDALVISTDSDRTLLEVVKQIAALRWDVPLLSHFIAGTPTFHEKAGQLAEGLVYGDSAEAACVGTSWRGCDVLAEFERRYGKVQSSTFMVASAVASFLAIKDAVRSGQDARHYLYQSKVETPLGVISFDKNGDVVGPVHTLKRLQGGKAHLFSK